MLILQHNDRTNWELTDKLSKAGFSDEGCKRSCRGMSEVFIILMTRDMQKGLLKYIMKAEV